TLFYDVQIVPVVSAKSILPSPLALLVMYIENIRRKIDVLILRFVSFSLGCNVFNFCLFFFFFSSRRRHTRLQGDWSSDVCSSDLVSLRIWIRHRSGFDREVDACEVRCLGEMTQRLATIGARKTQWESDSGADQGELFRTADRRHLWQMKAQQDQ